MRNEKCEAECYHNDVCHSDIEKTIVQVSASCVAASFDPVFVNGDYTCQPERSLKPLEESMCATTRHLGAFLR